MEDLNEKRNAEKGLYDVIYSGDDPYYADYGRHMHAKRCLGKIEGLKINSLIDVGCGKGQFPLWARQHGIETVYGIDFAAKFPKDTKGVTFFRGWAHELPLEDNAVEFVTSFDMMEHLIPEDTHNVLDEFDRVSSKGMIFSISYIPSVTKVNGQNLHPNVHPEEWWIETLSKYGKVEKYDIYLIVHKG